MYASLRLMEKLQQMIMRGTRDALLCKLAVLSVNVFCSNKETVFASLFQVCVLRIGIILSASIINYAIKNNFLC